MRFPEGLVVDTEKTLGELKFAALRRENYAQDEEGNVTDEIKKRTYDLKCQRQGTRSQSVFHGKPEKKRSHTMQR